MNSTVSLRHIPPELVVSILEYYILEITSKSQFIPLLLVSKTIYNWIIPKVYHALILVSKETRPPDIDRTKLLFASANPSNFLYVRRLASVNAYTSLDPNYLAPFANLTHLFLVGFHDIRHSEALGVPNLPLEELVIRDVRDRRNLFKILSPESRLAFTLRRFSSSVVWTEEDFTGLEVCKQLTHMMLREVYSIPTPVLRKFMKRQNMLCWLLILRRLEIDWFDKTHQILEPLRDSRIVLAKEEGKMPGTVESAMYFWKRQSAVWNAAETSIAQNCSSKAITVLDMLLY